ncbi:MAG: protein kinase [Planctomycetaceae bacterium]|jgi:serine/threonine-protein kinase|nr:protein kinase [Planctomycetaceae bacterium]
MSNDPTIIRPNDPNATEYFDVSAREPSAFSAGFLLGGNFRLEKQLGRGGMGEAWKAFDETAERNVVLKFVPKEIQHVKEAMDSVKESFKKVHALQHQHVCPVYGLFTDPQHGLYLVMKYVEGMPLDEYKRKYIEKHGQMTFTDIVQILWGIAKGLDYAHEKKVIHRDIKPQNIMVSKTDGVQIIDFGLAEEIRTSMVKFSEVQMDVAGTRPYMAPEQWQGKYQDAKTDQYALAVTAYEMFSGHVPFMGSDVGILRECVLHDEPEPIPGIPDYVNVALIKALSKKREDRYLNCKAFIKAMITKPKQKANEAVNETVNDDMLSVPAETIELPPDKSENQSKQPIWVPQTMLSSAVPSPPASPISVAKNVPKAVKKPLPFWLVPSLSATIILIVGLLGSFLMQPAPKPAAKVPPKTPPKISVAKKSDEKPKTPEIKTEPDPPKEPVKPQPQNLLALSDDEKRELQKQYPELDWKDANVIVLPKPAEGELRKPKLETPPVSIAEIPNAVKVKEFAVSKKVQTKSYQTDWSSDERLIAAVAEDYLVAVWDAKTGKELAFLDDNVSDGRAERGTAVALIPKTGGNRYDILFGTSMEKIILWNPDTQKIVWDKQYSWANYFAVDLEKKRIYAICRSKNNILIIDLDSGERVHSWQIHGESGKSNALALFAGGTRLLSAFDNNTVAVWNTETGKPVMIINESSDVPVPRAAISPDATMIVTATSGGAVNFRDAATGDVLRKWGGCGGQIVSLTFSPDSSKLAVTRNSGDNGTVIVDTKTCQAFASIPSGDWNCKVGWSRDSRQMVTAGGNPSIWDVTNAAAARTRLPDEVFRITIEIDVDGKGRFRAENGLVSDPPDNLLQSGEAFPMSAFPHAAAFRGKDGRGRVIWDFHDPLENWSKSGWGGGWTKGDRIDTEQGLFIQEPMGNPNFKVAQFLIPKKPALPFRLCVDYGGEWKRDLHFDLIENEDTDAAKNKLIRFAVRKNDSTGLFVFQATTDTAVKSGQSLMIAEKVSLQNPFDQTFQLPEEAVKLNFRFLAFRKIYQSSQMKRLDITARFSSSWGFSVKQSGKTLIVDSVQEKGSAKRAGLQTGDVIVQINGKEYNEAEARRRIGSATFGDKIVLTALRNGERKELQFYAE